jgi:predicted nucleic acid-binding protein
MLSFDTNVLVYATAALAADRVSGAQDLLARAMRATTSILLLQSLAEFSNVAIRRGRIPANAVKMMIEAWLAVLPVQSTDDSDLVLALEALHAHRLPFLGCNVVGVSSACRREAHAERRFSGWI